MHHTVFILENINDSKAVQSNKNILWANGFQTEEKYSYRYEWLK